MSTNLRLSDAAAEALRAVAQQSGRSQQDLLREAVDRFLGLSTTADSRARAVAAGLVRPPSAFADVEPTLDPGPGGSSLALLHRDDER